MSTLPEVQLGSDAPLYNIGVVARMTNVSMATLRAWERRYDFPEVERTSGGHRLYSEKDILRLRWVKSRIDEGLQTAQAIQALRHQETLGRTLQVESEMPPGSGSRSAAAGVRSEPYPHMVRWGESLFEALVRADLPGADLILNEALSSSAPEDLILDVISPVFARVGEAWENGQINVATEHLATNYLRQRLLMWMLNSPAPRSTGTIVLACGPNEWHEGGLLALGAVLRRRRWPVVYLGQSVPLPDLAYLARELNPLLVVLVAMTEISAAELLDWPRFLPEAAQKNRPIIGYGGRIFTIKPDWRLRMAGIYLGSTLREGLQTIEHLLI